MGEDRTKSGQMPAVKGYRRKLDSIAEHQYEAFDEANAKLERAAQKCRTSAPPPPSGGGR